jgi:Cu/Zn superoxide dismutase
MQINRAIIAATAALVLFAPLAVDAKKMSMTKSYPIAAENGSGETGTVTLTPAGDDKTTVVVSLTGAPAAAQPAHIHMGTCAALNPAPKYPLTSLINGKSTTTVPVSMASIDAGGFAVNVHKSADDLKDYVACGDLKPMSDGMMKPGTMASPGAMMSPSAMTSPGH